MLSMKPAQAQKFFFDTKLVAESMDKATRTVLSKFGAFVRRRARSSMRRKKKISQAGQPPAAHTGRLKELIFFAADLPNQSVVIGPVALNGDGGQVPSLLEYGGEIKRSLNAIGNRVGRRSRNAAKTVVMHYTARPSMHPALEEEEKNLPPLWTNSLK